MDDHGLSSTDHHPPVQLTARQTVRQRVSNACIRCRRQKIKCSGSTPCNTCRRRKLACTYDDQRDKVLVNRELLARLEREARESSREKQRSSGGQPYVVVGNEDDTEATTHAEVRNQRPRNTSQPPSRPDLIPNDAARLDIELPPEVDHDDSATSHTIDAPLVNSLMDVPQSYTTDESGQQFYLGTSSNWSFGKRVLSMVHERLNDGPLPVETLQFKSEVYSLEYMGSCGSDGDAAAITLPTADFASFLINGVQFRYGQLFHLFDEQTFMHELKKFHRGTRTASADPDLWFVHYLLLLALGKTVNSSYCQGCQPPGAEFFYRSMRVVPHLALARSDPVESIEILCCAAIYLQSLHQRQAAYNLVGQALRIAMFEGMHTHMRNRRCSEAVKERCSAAWWTTYVLDCHMSGILGVPQSLSANDVSTELPQLATSAQDSLALNIHVKLAKSVSSILKTVYSKDGQTPGKFIDSIKNALRNLAVINDLRIANFPVQLGKSSGGVSRISAYLLLFQHQCVILAARPLLFCFLQYRLTATRPSRVPSLGGTRSLLRVSLGAARQILRLLLALQAQGLLETFLPFDLESAWSAAVLTVVANAIDPSLLGDCHESIQAAHYVLDEMIMRGNLVASSYKDELLLLERSLEKLETDSTYPERLPNRGEGTTISPTVNTASDEAVNEWWFENVVSAEQLNAVADSLSLDGLEWLTSGSFQNDFSALDVDLSSGHQFY